VRLNKLGPPGVNVYVKIESFNPLGSIKDRMALAVIEHAERFGLSNLHQLRGRVGRGERQSYAFLIYSNRLTETGIARLKAIMKATDGFEIAEQDLKIRGPGEFLGQKQSGFPRFRIADLISYFLLVESLESLIGRIDRLCRGVLT